MKKFHFKTQESIIKGIEEKPIKKGFNWDRVIYLVTLLIIVVSFGSYFISKSIKVTAESEVIMDKFNVTFTNDVIVTEFYVEEGDSIRKGDSLFNYILSREADDDDMFMSNKNDRGYSKETENYLVREKLQTERDLQKARMEIKSLEREIKSLKKEIDKTEKKVFLDVEPPSAITSLKKEINDAEMEMSQHEDEIDYLKNYLAITTKKLENLRSQIPQVNIGELQGILSDEVNRPKEYTYISPKSGMVSQVYARSDEVRYKSTLVLDIIEYQGLHILAYFKQKDLKYIEAGDKVEVTFPDGTKSAGIIDKLYPKTATMPDRLYDSGSKVERRIRAVVVPLNVEEASKWYGFYKINVIVSKSKYF